MNPMIALWAHPRSCSTALERVFIERGDFQVFHEPFAPVAFDQHSAMPSDDLECGLPSAYETIKRLLRSARRDQPVFHKDMAYHCLNELRADPKFLLEQQHVFIIREPGHSILSHFAMYPHLPLEAIGHKALYELFCTITLLTGNIPYVIHAEDLASHPVDTVQQLCHHLGLAFVPRAISGEQTCPPEWLTCRSWQQGAESNARISEPSSEVLDPELLAQYPRMKAYYDYHRPFYDRMNPFTQGRALTCTRT